MDSTVHLQTALSFVGFLAHQAFVYSNVSMEVQMPLQMGFLEERFIALWTGKWARLRMCLGVIEQIYFLEKFTHANIAFKTWLFFVHFLVLIQSTNGH
jgi:hypothetical protein